MTKSSATKTLVAASANNIALSQTPVSGTALTLNGSTVTSGVARLDSARRVLVTFGVEASARTIVILGTNETGNIQGETVAIASGGGSTVATVQDFMTITSMIPAGGGFSAAITVGTNTTGSSPWKLVNKNLAPFELSLNLNITGTATCSIEYTYDSPQGFGLNTGNYPWTFPTIPQAILHPSLQGVTASVDGSLKIPITAWRLTITAGTGLVVASGINSGIA